MNKENYKLILIILIFTIIGALLILWITPYGSGISPDSTIYLESAQNIIEGHGFVNDGEPVTHYPPAFPIVLSTIGFFGDDLVHVARYFNSFLFGVNIVLAAIMAYGATDKKIPTFIIAALFSLATAPLIEIHSMAWTEPLFITFTLFSIYLLAKFYKNPTNLLLIFSAITIGLSVITRYIGIVFIPAGLAIVVTAIRNHTYKEKIQKMFGWSALALTPIGLFILRNLLVAKNATDRSIVFHPIPILEFIGKVIINTFDFFAPTSFPYLIRVLLFLIFGVLVLFLTNQSVRYISLRVDNRQLNFELILISFLFTISYLSFLYLSISFIDAATPVNKRIMSPILLIFSLGLFQLFWLFSISMNKPIVWWLFLVITLLSISIKSKNAIQVASTIQINGLGYTSKEWRNSEIIGFVQNYEIKSKIYTNGGDILDFSANLESDTLPVKYSSNKEVDNPNFFDEFEFLCSDIRENEAVILYFDQISRKYLPSKEEIEATCNIFPTKIFSDGVLYGDISK